MVRQYKRKPGSRRYLDFSSSDEEAALKAIRDKKISVSQAARDYNICRMTLYRRLKGERKRPPGGQTVLSAKEEKMIVDNILTCADWGYPFTMNEIRLLVKDYLDDSNRTTKFKNNYPGYDWGRSFLKRHKAMTLRLVENQKAARSKVGPENVRKYFNNLQVSIEGVPPENIINYDETAFVDDPGREKAVVRRKTKYPIVIRESSRLSVSVMMACSASGHMLPPYIVYKSTCMWSSWIMDSLYGSRYNRTKSGWFDAVCFEDWFRKIALRYLKHLPGRKVIIGDNLSSHISLSVIQSCEKYNISFILLPPNATHLLQPLDVCVFRPVKISWRKVVKKWKQLTSSSKAGGNPFKENFPRLLKETLELISNRSVKNICSGFAACGIHPFDPDVVLKKFPGEETFNKDDSAESVLHVSLVSMLQRERFGGETPSNRGRKKKIQVSPGKSVRGIHFDSQAPVTSTPASQVQVPLSYSSEDDSSSESGISDLLSESEEEYEEPQDDFEEILELEEEVIDDSAPDNEGSSSNGAPAENDEGNSSNLALNSFVAATYQYSTGSRQQREDHVRYYIGRIEEVNDEMVNIMYMKKYMNRSTEYVFVSAYDNGNERVDEDQVPISRIKKVLHAPEIKRGGHIFKNTQNIEFLTQFL